MNGQDVTESWREKNYEEKYTDFFFRAGMLMAETNNLPTTENVQRSFSAVKSVAYVLIYSNAIMKKFRSMVKPVLKDIEIVLYADMDSRDFIRAERNLGITVQNDPRTKKRTITNAQNILSELWEIYFFTKQWAYEMGFFAKKPFGRKYGKEAIQDVMDM